MIFMENLNSKLIFFINQADTEVLIKFIIGFYQIENIEIDNKYYLDIDSIDTKTLKTNILAFLNRLVSIEKEVKQATPSEEMAFFLTHIAHIYASLMLIEKSLLFYRESIKVRENYLGVKSLATAENYQGIGAMYEQGSAFNEALRYYKKSLDIRKELSYVDNNLLVAESYSRLALVYYHLEHYNLALGYMEQTVKIREKLLSSAHTLLQNSYYHYELIEKACQPKQDYLRQIMRPINNAFGAFINHLVGQK